MHSPRVPNVGDMVLCYFEASGCALCWSAAIVTGKPDPRDPMKVDLNVFPARHDMYGVTNVAHGDGSMHPAWRWRSEAAEDPD